MTERPYGRLPRQIYPHLVNCYDVLKKYKVPASPYRVLGEMFGVSHQRIQQVVLAERERLQKEADLGESVAVRPKKNHDGQVAPRDPSGPVEQRDTDTSSTGDHAGGTA